MQGLWVQSLNGELRSHMPHRNKTVTFDKDFRSDPYQKKNLKKREINSQGDRLTHNIPEIHIYTNKYDI